ncbi:MAG: 5-(carboxyamino)imidazole ribonucleotide mutase [Gammaproteobacteria bacterium]|nr:5-(carboxyamino)imidazole ribonucleotide mutase [Gammaproteobacteria bacterium]
MSQPFVAVLMGSKSDLPVLEKTLEVLEGLGIPHEARITSAHRTPEATHAYVRDADARGCAVFIAAAGLAAHLAGTVAGLTLRPVIGIPLDAGPLKGIDSLLSTVQMPGGIPVATVGERRRGAGRRRGAAGIPRLTCPPFSCARRCGSCGAAGSSPTRPRACTGWVAIRSTVSQSRACWR